MIASPCLGDGASQKSAHLPDGLDIAGRIAMRSHRFFSNGFDPTQWPSLRASRIWVALPAILALAPGCSAIESVAVAGTDFGGATADAHCDRRYVTDGGQPSAFCQEIVATLAASQFADDCRSKHMATAGPGLCPRANVIAGCKLNEKHDDKSVATDWYYDVRGLAADGGIAGDRGLVFEPPTPRSTNEVATVCADPSRYADGSELVNP